MYILQFPKHDMQFAIYVMVPLYILLPLPGTLPSWPLWGTNPSFPSQSVFKSQLIHMVFPTPSTLLPAQTQIHLLQSCSPTALRTYLH